MDKSIKNQYNIILEMIKMIKINLSRILGERRTTQAELARATGIRPLTICHMYNEIIERVNLEYLDRICEHLNISLDELIEYIPNRQKKTAKQFIKD
jgi:putative transcriptional regulator